MSTTAQQSSDASCDRAWKFESEFAQRFYACVQSPRAIAASMQLAAGDYEGLNTLSVDSRCYREPERFAEDYQVAELLRKSCAIPGVSPQDRGAAALRKFLLAEEANAATNARLMADRLPAWFGDFSYQVLRILGDLTVDRLNRIAERGGFGPGANVGVAGDGLVPSIKFDTIPVATLPVARVLSGLMPACVYDFWGNPLEKARVVSGNSHFTVPKQWDIDRCAAKEPLWNSYLQAGIGRDMIDRLLRFGVDLHDQTWNQYLASKAQDWGLATIDLSSASDMLSRVLVWLALCYNGDVQGKRWFHLLNMARSPVMKMPDGSARALEMFASMGNSFTFPLETVIFLALIRCTVRRESWCVCTAYGDDIIVPQADASSVVERLEYLGFQVNRKKTCLAGTFFESCGTDWFHGRNVRPFYLRQTPGSPVPYPLQAANALRAWCLRVFGYIPDRYKALWSWCKGQVPQSWRHPVPASMGDVGLHVSLREARGRIRLARGFEEWEGWEGYAVKHVVMTPICKDRRSFGVLAAALAKLTGVSDSATYGLEPVRGLYGRPRVTQSVVLWEDDVLV